jgi:hypothetical protein
LKARLLPFLLLFTHACLAADSYYIVPLSSLTFLQSPPSNLQWTNCNADKLDFMQAYAVLDGAGEAFVTGEPTRLWDSSDLIYKNTLLAIRVPKGRPVSGRLFFLKPDVSGLAPLPFTLNTSESSASAFFAAKSGYYRRLREHDLPGAAWFGYQENEATKSAQASASYARPKSSKPSSADGLTAAPPLPEGEGRGEGDLGTSKQPVQLPPRRHFSEYNFDATFHIFNDNPSFAQHLPLEALQLPTATTATIPITNIAGISPRNFDWKSLLHNPKPSLDALSANIPYDQHAFFFPSFEALNQFLETANHEVLPLLKSFRPRTTAAAALARYETQLCLEPNSLSRLVAPQLISTVAITGSDLYLNTGTDLAVLFQTTSPKTLKALIEAAQALAGQSNPSVSSFTAEVNQTPYSAAVSEDQSISSYVVALENLVLISNSRPQLERLINVTQQKIPSLSSQDDYLYFRQKFSTNATETAFFVLSDATIHRWCSPRSRIGHSRQLRAAAALAQLQAAHLAESPDNFVKPGPAPISSLPLSQVTPAESTAYNRWRTTFEQNFTQFFNPLALRLSLQSQHLTAELCVSPPPTTSELRPFLPLIAGAHLTSTSGDSHSDSNAFVQIAVAINSESEPIKETLNLLSGFNRTATANPLAWLGPRVTAYAVEDPIWTELGRSSNPTAFLRQNFYRLPIALKCEAKNPFSFALFLLAARGLVAQGLTTNAVWADLDYNGQPFTKITLRRAAQTQAGVKNCMYYAATTNFLIISPSELVLKRALDGQRSHSAALTDSLGSNISLTFRKPTCLEHLLRSHNRTAAAALAWSNLPILNEWKRCFPGRDPAKLHEQLPDSSFVSLPGDHYIWNDQLQTMESFLYGCPGQPKAGPENILSLSNLTSANLGLTLENDSSIATLLLERAH